MKQIVRRKRATCGRVLVHRRLAYVVAAVMAITCAAGLAAETFSFNYHKGEKFRILSTVNEEVYYNRRFSHRSEILNRISYTIADTKDGSGLIDGLFLTSEKISGGGEAYQWSAEYPSKYWRDAQGRYTIDPGYYMPVVRNVPFFPDRDLRQGETWSAEGTEVQDFRDDFGIPEPYVIPFTAKYAWTGTEEHDGKSFDVITASYTIFYEPPVPAAYRSVYPANIMGYSDQKILWDREHGEPASYTEKFKFVFVLSDGTVVEYRGTAEAHQTEAKRMDHEQVAQEIREKIETMKIPDTTVASTEQGVTINLSNIQFLPDSAVLVPPELGKLEKIGTILAGYPDRDIMIAGHTALAGTKAGRQQLSEERAQAVGDYFIKHGIRSPEHVITRGFGAERPLADNSTEEGMRQNRRVEITILEN